MLAESLALMSIDISPEHPNHKENFERFLCKRDDIELILKLLEKFLDGVIEVKNQKNS